MGFTATLKEKKQQPNGNVRETYSWVMDGGTTTGTITADTTIQPEIQKINVYGASSDGDSASLVVANDTADNQLKITSGANDTGECFIEGPAA